MKNCLLVIVYLFAALFLFIVLPLLLYVLGDFLEENKYKDWVKYEVCMLDIETDEEHAFGKDIFKEGFTTGHSTLFNVRVIDYDTMTP